MKKLFVLLTFVLFINGCGKDDSVDNSPGTIITKDGDSKLTITSDLTDIIENGFKVTEVKAKISSNSISNSVELNINSVTASGVFEKLSSGNYEIQVEAFQHSTLIYSGSKNIAILLGKDLNVSQELSFAQLIEPKGELIKGVVPVDYITDKFFLDGYNYPGNEPLNTLNQNGVDWVRVGVTNISMKDLKANPAESWISLPWKTDYWSSLEWAEQIFKEAKELGMRLNLFFFFSDTAAHAGVQDAPSDWENLSIEATADLIEEFTFQTTKYYIDNGYNIEIYDIGNEITKGFANFRPGERLPLPPAGDGWNLDYWINTVWKPEAMMLKAAIKGLKRADPDAKIVIHIVGLLGISENNIFAKTFFETMYLEDVDFDYAGLTYPYLFENTNPIERPYFNSKSLKELINFIGALDKKVIFSEYSFPNSSNGGFLSPPPGYDYSPSGQAQWLNDFLNFVNNDPIIKGAFYFYPEYYPGMSDGNNVELESIGLFENITTPQPAQSVFNNY